MTLDGGVAEGVNDRENAKPTWINRTHSWKKHSMPPLRLAILLFAFLLTTPSHAARCGGDFNSFVQNISAEAASTGISQGVIASALGGVQQDMAVLNLRPGASVTPSTSPSSNMSRPAFGSGRINGGRAAMQRHAALLVEHRSQVRRAAANTGGDLGAGDRFRQGRHGPAAGCFACSRPWRMIARRTELFQGELIAALKIVQRGDLPLGQMVGAYAGEIGQTQFLPSSYVKYGRRFRRRRPRRSPPSTADVLASTANLFAHQRLQDGRAVRRGKREFEAMREWNHATIYRKTIAYFADQLGGAVRLAEDVGSALILRSRHPGPRKARPDGKLRERLEGWPQVRPFLSSFETRPGPLLRMRSAKHASLTFSPRASFIARSQRVARMRAR